jgi:membrane-associated phospholipid phosphatase
MFEPKPSTENRLAVWIGLLFHPYFICIPAGMLLLNDLPVLVAFAWMMVMVAIVLPSLLFATAYVEKRGHQVYERAARPPLYITFFVTLWVCLGILTLFQAPRILIACVAILLLWIPVHLALNTFVTKVSSHAAVVAGCLTGLAMMDKLPGPGGIVLGVIAVVVVLWARVTTHHHTWGQVLLGVVTGIVPVAVVFSLIL